MRLPVLFLLFHCIVALPQKILHGKVVDAQTGQALEGANVFVANTTRQTLTNEAGQFSIVMPEEAAQLVLTFVGYSPQVLTSADFPDRLVRYVVPMQLETNELRPVAVLSKKRRDQLLKQFYAHFLGTSANARETRLLNPDEIIFYLNDDDSWEASAAEPLQIENPNLNYKLDFVLTLFKMMPRDNKCVYMGYPSFSDLKTTTRKHRGARLQAYMGSQMHFLRSAYQNTTSAEGFHINQYKLELNPMYTPVVKLDSAYARQRVPTKEIQPKYIVKYLAKNIDASYFVTGENSVRYLSFTEYLEVTYLDGFEEEAFAQLRHGHKSHPVSHINMETAKARIFPDGNIEALETVIFNGYMG